jgi:hypothetical protein
MAVHDIEVMPVRAGLFGAADFFVETPEIAGEDGWSDQDGMHFGKRHVFKIAPAYIPGNGGALRQWMIHQMTATMSAVAIAAIAFRAGVGSGAGIGGLLVHERVDLFREFEVEIGEATLAVRGKAQAHLAVADVDLGMMLVLLGDLGDAVHELDRLREVVELERALDVFLFEVPFREFFHPVFDVFGFQ